MVKKILAGVVAVFAAVGFAQTVVDVTGIGAEKTSVSINVGNSAYAKCLQKNLEISGLFIVKGDGAIKVTGASGAVTAVGKGKSLSASDSFADEKSARMAARKLANAMCEAYGDQKGFALDKVIFLNRGKAAKGGVMVPGELCVAYPDGYDIRQLTSDKTAAVYPRWKKGGEGIYYIGYLKGAPQIWEMDINSGKRNVKWSFKGSPTGIAVAPDGRRVAAILSFQGNPELYVLDGERYIRLTNTPNASEGQPTWSPDGTKIAYVSDETRRPQIYVVDVNTKEKRRLTAKGRENLDPDWGADGRITYITKRGGAQIAIMGIEGDSSSKVLTTEGTWEHPSWARDSRHVVADRDGALFIVDTMEGGDKPRRMFYANGNWISPSWSK